MPADPRRLQDDPLRDPVAAAQLDRGVRHVQDLYHHFVVRPGVVGIDDTDAVRHHQAALQRRAAAGKYGKKVAARNLDDEAGPDEYYFPGRYGYVMGRRQVEAC